MQASLPALYPLVKKNLLLKERPRQADATDSSDPGFHDYETDHGSWPTTGSSCLELERPRELAKLLPMPAQLPTMKSGCEEMQKVSLHGKAGSAFTYSMMPCAVDLSAPQYPAVVIGCPRQLCPEGWCEYEPPGESWGSFQEVG
jgi:hypothetical protein